MRTVLLRASGHGLGFLLLAVATAALRPLQPNPADVALTYLLVVLAASTVGGLWSGAAVAAVAMLAFNFFFLPPIGTLTIAAPPNWFALFAFMITAIVSSQLVARARARSAQAEARERQTRALLQLSERLIGHVASPGDIPGATAALAQDCAVTLGAERALVCPWTPDGPALPAEAPDWSELPAAERALGRVMPRAPLRLDCGGGHALLVLPLGRRSAHPALLLAAGGPHLQPGMAEAVGGLASLALDRLHLMRQVTEAETLRQSDRLKSALLASVSHELRTPLAAIRVAATTLQRPDVWQDPAGRGDLLETLDLESERLNRVFSNLFCMSRVQAGPLVLDRRPCDPEEVVWEGVHQAGLRLDAARLRWSVPDGLPPVWCDLPLAGLALANLLDNAAKYGPAGSPIEVGGRLSAEGGLVALWVDDAGPGVTAAEAQQIFQPFYRPPGRRRGGPAGAGLGLSIARAVVEAHGGRIWFEAGTGGGSRFTVTWPVAAASPAETGMASAAARP